VANDKKTMRGKSHGPASLPSAALPASGSKGSIDVRADHLSQAAPPHLFLVQNKTRKKDVKGGSAAPSDDAKILAAFGCVNLTSSKGLLDPPPEFTSHSDVATADQLLFRCCLLFYVGVKDRVPFAILHLPDRPGVCRSLRRLCLPRWLPPSPGRSRAPCLHRS